MAWNEPGGNGGDKDPWGGGNQGPPDLDEALRKLQEKLGGIFGGGGGGSTGNSSGGVPRSLIMMVVGVLLVEPDSDFFRYLKDAKPGR